MKGIPTKYRGVQFRSRLEAKWAAFFDLLGWGYEYEPFDLNGWIPDFLLLGEMPVLVEVKPATEFPRLVANIKIDAAFSGHPPFEPLIVGLTPIFNDPYYDNCIGWLGEKAEGESGHWWEPAPWGRWEPAGRFGFCHAVGWYKDRITGGHDGSFGIGLTDVAIIRGFWAEAGNRVQWNTPR